MLHRAPLVLAGLVLAGLTGLTGFAGCWSGSTAPPPAPPSNTAVATPTTSFGFDIGDALELGMVIGPPGAKVTIVEAFDFACPHCGTFDPILTQVVDEYGGRVRVVFKPFVLRDRSKELHMYGCAAGIQRKFVAFKAALFKSREVVTFNFSDQPGPVIDPDVANAVGLDGNRLAADAQSDRCRKIVERSHAELEKHKVDFLPRHFLNGEPVDATNKGELRSAIDARL